MPLFAGTDRPRRRGTQLVAALVLALISLFSYLSSGSYNPVTERSEHVDLTPRQEIALGLQAQSEMAAQYGGVSANPEAQHRVQALGEAIVRTSSAGKTGYPFQFTALGDQRTINAFALPGGPVFITSALLSRLTTEGELAGVLAHEIGHVVARHAAQQLAKTRLTQGLTGAAVLATYDPDRRGSADQAAMVAALVGQLVSLKYGRGDELDADRLGVRFMSEAGYDPRAMISVMKILQSATQGGGRQPEFFSTHPNPEHRIERIEAAIGERYPSGVPDGLKQ